MTQNNAMSKIPSLENEGEALEPALNDEQRILRLSRADTEAVLNLLENLPLPHPALIAAFEQVSRLEIEDKTGAFSPFPRP